MIRYNAAEIHKVTSVAGHGQTYRTLRQAVAVIAVLAGLGSGAAWAQTASQITPPSFAPAPTNLEGQALEIKGGTGLRMLPGAEKLSVRVGRVIVEGGIAGLGDKTQEIVSRLTNQTVTADKIFAAAHELEEAYSRAGYVLTRVALPQQNIVNGADVRLLVLNGYIERIDASTLSSRVRGRVEDVLAPLVGDQTVRIEDLERRLLLAGDTPGVLLKSTLVAGAQTGGSVLVIEADYQPVTGVIGYNNMSVPELGRNSSSIGANVNSVLGGGELAYVRVGGDVAQDFIDDDARNRSLAAGVLVPVGHDGLTVNLEAVNVNSTPDAAVGSPTFHSEFERYTARVQYPVVRSRALNVSTNASFDVKNETLEATEPLQADISRDRVRVARVGADAQWAVDSTGGTMVLGALASFGLDVLGARSADDATPVLPLSRQGADADFQKAEVSMRYVQPIVDHLTADVQARGQTSFGDPLVNSEQFGLASVNGLSSFDNGALNGDAGYLVRTELQAPFTFPFNGGGALVSPYLFGALGAVRLEQPTVVERPLVRAKSYGAGLRLGAGLAGSRTNTSVTVEVGRQERSDDRPTDTQANVMVNAQF